MHEERFEIPESTAQTVNDAKRDGRRVIAVGTTSLRVLESVAHSSQDEQLICGVKAGAGRTRIFIYPPYEWRHVDALITNFHLPESTLLMLVSSFAGREAILDAYRHAVAQRYRFFSYGDAMLILPPGHDGAALESINA